MSARGRTESKDMHAGTNRGQDSTGLKDVPPPYHGVNYLDRTLQLNWQSQTSHRGYSGHVFRTEPTPWKVTGLLQGRQGQLHLAMLPGSSGPGCQAGGRLAPRPLPSPSKGRPPLTGSARRCARPRSPPATRPPPRAGAGRPSWSQACPGRRTSAGTGSVAPAGAPPASGAEAGSPGT